MEWSEPLDYFNVGVMENCHEDQKFFCLFVFFAQLYRKWIVALQMMFKSTSGFWNELCDLLGIQVTKKHTHTHIVLKLCDVHGEARGLGLGLYPSTQASRHFTERARAPFYEDCGNCNSVHGLARGHRTFSPLLSMHSNTQKAFLFHLGEIIIF